MCGIGGVRGPTSVNRVLYAIGTKLINRGQSESGMATYYKGTPYLKKGKGTFNQVFKKKEITNFLGKIGILQTRYPTSGKQSRIGTEYFIASQPLIRKGKHDVLLVHNGQITNYEKLKDEIFDTGHALNSENDGAVLHYFLSERICSKSDGELTNEDIFESVSYAMNKCRGAYSVLATIDEKLVAFRDPLGIRPLSKAQMIVNNEIYHGYASETIALQETGFNPFTITDVLPGYAEIINEDLTVSTKKILDAEDIVKDIPSRKTAHCAFEYAYFSNPESRGISKARSNLGKLMGELFLKTGLEADYVCPVPDSARTAAISFSSTTGIKYAEDALTKNRYRLKERNFIEDETTRKSDILDKFHTNIWRLSGKIVLIDDSMVRATTMKRIAQKLKSNRQSQKEEATEIYRQIYKNSSEEHKLPLGMAHLKYCMDSTDLKEPEKIYVVLSFPPIYQPCFYGIDMQRGGEFIYKKHTEKFGDLQTSHGTVCEEIAKTLNVDAVIYPSLEQYAKAIGFKPEQLCLACVGQAYPTGLTLEDIASYSDQRNTQLK